MVLRFLHIPHNPRPQKIDWWGAVTIVIAVVPFLLVAEQGREWGWASPLAIAMYLLGTTGIISFILIERKMKDTALLPLKLFTEPTFARTQLMGFIIGIGMFGGMITLPLVLQVVYGASPTEAGLLMLPMVGGLMVSSIVSGKLMSKTGKYRIFFNLGTGILLAGYLYLLLVLDASIPIWVVSIGMVMIGLGLGQLLQTTTVASQNSVHGRDIGVATSSITFFRQMGGTFGVAVFMSILFSQVTSKIVGAFDNETVKAGLAEALSDRAVTSDPANAEIIRLLQDGAAGAAEITVDSSFLIGADDRLTLPFRIGFVDSALNVFLLATVFVGIAFVISFFIKEIPLRDKSASQEVADSSGI